MAIKEIEGGRMNLVTLFGQLGFRVGAEIGVWRGELAKYMFVRIPGLKLYLIDSWKHYPSDIYDDELNRSQAIYNCSYRLTKTQVDGFNAVILRKTSMEALSDIPDSSLDFVFIDANHTYKYVKEDLEGWYKKVRKGGIVSGHDVDMPSVRKAVKEFTNNRGVELFELTAELSHSFYFYVK